MSPFRDEMTNWLGLDSSGVNASLRSSSRAYELRRHETGACVNIIVTTSAPCSPDVAFTRR